MEGFFSQEGLIALTSQVSLFALGIAFLTGAVVSFSPASLPAIPAVMGFVAGSRQSSSWAAMRLSGAFVLGIVTIDSIMGAVFATAGSFSIRFISANLALWNLVIAILLVALGLWMLRVFTLRLPAFSPILKKAETPGAAYLVGIPFGLAACPSCTPLLLPIAAGAAAAGSPWFGASLLAAFGLGRGTVLLAVGTSTGRVKKLALLSRYVPWIEKGSGGLLLALSIYFFWQFFDLV